jgi:hypothetical protein
MLKDKPSLPMISSDAGKITSAEDGKDLTGNISKTKNAPKSTKNVNIKEIVNGSSNKKLENDGKTESNSSNQGKSRIMPME